ncbi:MAG: peroxidase family protein [Aestuariivirga sp.]|uniref:peroxidase family protein n=1 Tax=Aestuariivirga sp. TaxID=2650926 RepID=UPI0038D122CB
MGIIVSRHGLDAPQKSAAAPSGAGRAWAHYCYLFPELSDKPDAGLFPGATARQTLARLQNFEEVYRQHHHATPRMRLAPVYTYFGQFMNHDLSAPSATAGRGKAGAAAMIIGDADVPDRMLNSRPGTTAHILARIYNEHQNPLLLDSLYADGPRSGDPDVRSLYEADGVRFRLARAQTLTVEQLSATAIRPDMMLHRKGAYDLPRDVGNGVAWIADRRNDENLIISQLHLALMLLHNKAAAALRRDIPAPAERFAAARRELTRHYHWCILNDYLPKLLSRGVLADVLAAPPRLPPPGQVPMEFTTAAFRFGHSMVSGRYDFNANFGKGGKAGKAATLDQLFAFTSHAKMGVFAGVAGQLPDHWLASWRRLTRLSGAPPGGADRIDMRFASGMLNSIRHSGKLRDSSIFFRNVMRGFFRRMAFGQDYARAYGLAPLRPARVLSAMPKEAREAAETAGLQENTPAWLYFLCEADALEDGERLGPVASRIIADTVTGLIRRHGGSLLKLNGRPWHPRDSVLKTRDGKPLDSLRMLLLCAEEEQPPESLV